jgi:hypothetical protein
LQFSNSLTASFCFGGPRVVVLRSCAYSQAINEIVFFYRSDKQHLSLELYQIRHFAAVVETGGITKAAIRAAVSRPALPVSIAKLEEELGVRLFHRSPKVNSQFTTGAPQCVEVTFGT